MVVAGGVDAAGVLRLSAEIYPIAAVRQAIAAYSSHARLSVETRGSYHEVTIQPVSGEGDELAGEIANYALAVAAQGVAT